MATTIGSRIYLAGGTEINALSSVLNMLWMLDMDNLASGWQELPGWTVLFVSTYSFDAY